MYDPSSSRGSFLGVTLTPTVRVLLIVLGAVFALELLVVNWWDLWADYWPAGWRTGEDLVRLFALKPQEVIERGFVWQVFTYMWPHSPGGLAHILFNILGLFFFGGILEQRWGGRAFLRFYLLSGVIAGLVVLGVGWFFDPSAHTMGASGGVLGLLAGFGIAMGGTPILLFGILPLRARTLLWIALAWVLLDWFMRRTDVSVAAHLGGIAAGALLVTGWWRPSKLRAALSERLRGRARVRFERRNGGKPWLN